MTVTETLVLASNAELEALAGDITGSWVDTSGGFLSARRARLRTAGSHPLCRLQCVPTSFMPRCQCNYRLATALIRFRVGF